MTVATIVVATTASPTFDCTCIAVVAGLVLVATSAPRVSFWQLSSCGAAGIMASPVRVTEGSWTSLVTYSWERILLPFGLVIPMCFFFGFGHHVFRSGAVLSLSCSFSSIAAFVPIKLSVPARIFGFFKSDSDAIPRDLRCSGASSIACKSVLVGLT